MAPMAVTDSTGSPEIPMISKQNGSASDGADSVIVNGNNGVNGVDQVMRPPVAAVDEPMEVDGDPARVNGHQSGSAHVDNDDEPVVLASSGTDEPIEMEPLEEVAVPSSDSINSVMAPEHPEVIHRHSYKEEGFKTPEEAVEFLRQVTRWDDYHKQIVNPRVERKDVDRKRQTKPCLSMKKNNNSKLADTSVCRDCFSGRSDENDDVGESEGDRACRFVDFRIFQSSATEKSRPPTFRDPYQESDPDDVKLWLPGSGSDTITVKDTASARLILTFAGDVFCRIAREENEVQAEYEARRKERVVFKRMSDVGREVCDICQTTIFNLHWVCQYCGFCVCIDCFREEKAMEDRRSKTWVDCISTSAHFTDGMMLVQNIPACVLEDVNHAMHFIRNTLGIRGSCGCAIDNLYPKLPPDADRHQKRERKIVFEEPDKTCVKLRKFFAGIRDSRNTPKRVDARRVRDNYWKMMEEAAESDKVKAAHQCRDLCNHPYTGSMSVYEDIINPKARADFLCQGSLLRIEGDHDDTISVFQREWRCGQPVLVTNVHNRMNLKLWTPQEFSREFGRTHNPLINSLNGDVMPAAPMRVFWAGFADYKERLVDDQNRPMLLKLKDWPPDEDFEKIMPSRFKDIMKGFPVQEYTSRTGNLNLATYLPSKFVPPDLGPKMYVAYGSAIHSNISSTNLHLDVSDAVNVMVYVGPCSEETSDVWRARQAVISAGCDESILQDLNTKVPGAIWQIYDACDSPKIRELLKKVARENGHPLSRKTDPIHDQQTYLDENLRMRLLKEYGVKGYQFIQCLGDAVFIPAGAPHQVRNLMNCVKAAEDFVSAETVAKCYELTKDFRRLSDNHTNHEDKLQIKNMVYHSVKSCLFHLAQSAEKAIVEHDPWSA